MESKMFDSFFIVFAQTEDFSFGQSYNYTNDFVNMLLSLLVVILVLMGTLWVLKKLMRSRLTYLNDTSAIRVLEKRVLNQKAALYLVEVMGKGVLICESSAGIQTLTTVEGEEWEAELASLNEPEESPAESTLSSWWKKLTRRHA
jgi:flagellar biogenesis protein FliO